MMIMVDIDDGDYNQMKMIYGYHVGDNDDYDHGG